MKVQCHCQTAKNELEAKKLKESNELKVKRILSLEAQLEEAKKMLSNNPTQNPTEFPSSVSDQQTKVSSLENRTIYLEQNLAPLQGGMHHCHHYS